MTMRAEHSGTTFESGAPHVTVWTGFDGLRKMEIGGDGLRLSTSKSISGTTGQFTLELLPRDGIGLTEKAIRSGAERLPLYLSAIAPNTPISIGFEREGGVMLGLVRSCDWTTFAVGDKLQDGITITGTDFGHMLDDHILQMQVSTADHARWTEAIKSVLGPDAPILKELVGAEGPVNAAGERSLEGVTVQAVAEYCLKRVAGMRVPVLRQAFGGRGYIGDFTEVRASSFDGDLVYKTGLFTQETTVSGYLQEILDKDTEPWGVKVAKVEIKNIDLPQEMQRAIAKQAEAERERRAKVIGAEGEFQAAQKLSDAAKIIGENPIALQLRYLQTLREVAAENNSTTIFPVPIDLLTPFMQLAKMVTPPSPGGTPPPAA